MERVTTIRPEEESIAHKALSLEKDAFDLTEYIRDNMRHPTYGLTRKPWITKGHRECL